MEKWEALGTGHDMGRVPKWAARSLFPLAGSTCQCMWDSSDCRVPVLRNFQGGASEAFSHLHCLK